MELMIYDLANGWMKWDGTKVMNAYGTWGDASIEALDMVLASPPSIKFDL